MNRYTDMQSILVSLVGLTLKAALGFTLGLSIPSPVP